MRISSSRIQKEDNTGNGINILKASAEASESRTDNFSETLNPTKDATDDAYTLLLPHAKPEEKVRLATNFPFLKIYQDRKSVV